MPASCTVNVAELLSTFPALFETTHLYLNPLQLILTVDVV